MCVVRVVRIFGSFGSFQRGNSDFKTRSVQRQLGFKEVVLEPVFRTIIKLSLLPLI